MTQRKAPSSVKCILLHNSSSSTTTRLYLEYPVQIALQDGGSKKYVPKHIFKTELSNLALQYIRLIVFQKAHIKV